MKKILIGFLVLVIVLQSMLIGDLAWNYFVISIKLNQLEKKVYKVNRRLGLDDYYVREGDIVNDRNLKRIVKKVFKKL